MSQTEPAGTIHVQREPQLIGFGMRAYVHLDGAMIGRLRPGEALTATTAPGARLLQVRGAGVGAIIASDTLLIHLRPGELAAIRLVIRRGVWRNGYQLQRVYPPRRP